MSDNDLGEFREFENGVRRGLSEMAGRIHPSDRLDAIVAAGQPKKRSPLWIVGAAAVFVLVAVLGVGYVLSLSQTTASTTSGAAAAPAEKDQAQPQAKSAESANGGAAASPSSANVPMSSWAMPVYWVVTGSQSQSWLLTRTFSQVQAPSDRTARVQKAVSATVGNIDTSWGSTPVDVKRPWGPGTTVSATVTDSLITLELSQPGVTGLTAQQQKVAVQGLVWTATAAAQLTVPVRVQVAGGGAVFPATPAGTYTRPASDLAYTDLVPIWVDSPGISATVGSPVTVTGEACVFEAQFSYELLQGSAVVKKGNVTASIGCPSRGTYSIPLGALAPGAYTIRLYETSMKDGSVFYETRTSFGVS